MKYWFMEAKIVFCTYHGPRKGSKYHVEIVQTTFSENNKYYKTMFLKLDFFHAWKCIISWLICRSGFWNILGKPALIFWKYDSWFSSEVSKYTSVFYPWNDSFSGMENIEFPKHCHLILIVLTKCGLYCLHMVFWSFFFGTIKCTKDNFCFHKPIFDKQVKLISYPSEFWHFVTTHYYFRIF